MARIAKAMGSSNLKDIDSAKAHAYLNQRLEANQQHKKMLHADSRPNYLSQKTLDAERKALSIFLKEDIARVYSSHQSIPQSRAYTWQQIDEIKRHQSPKNALSTELAAFAGLRASELLTLRRGDELDISTSRSWHKDRFTGEEGIKYVTKGKGGLVREVIIPKQLAERLEATRLSTPKEITDRGIRYSSYYDLSGGNSFSKSFSHASSRSLGFSNGAHGLRHSQWARRSS